MERLSKQLGKRLLLRNLIFSHRSINRPSLIRESGINARSVDRYVQELSCLGLVQCSQAQGSRGRPSMVYTSNSDNCLFVGAIIDSWHLSVTVLDINGKPLFCQATPCPSSLSFTELESVLDGGIIRAMQQCGQQMPYAICLGLPTQLDHAPLRDKLLHALRSRFRTQVECLSTDILITHEAITHTWLKGRIAGIIFSSAFVIFEDGRPTTQYDKRLQPLWHLRPPAGLELNLACACGRRGCLQAELSGDALVERYRRLPGASPGNPFLTSSNIILEANLGTPRAVAALRSQAELFGYLAARLQAELPLNHIITLHSSHFNQAMYAEFARDAFARWSGASPNQFRPYAYSWADMAFAASQYARRNFSW